MSDQSIGTWTNRKTHRGGRGGFRGVRTHSNSSLASGSIATTTPGPGKQLVGSGLRRSQMQAEAELDHTEQQQPEIWEDVESWLLGFLEGRAYSSIRATATAQSLNTQGLNYLATNKAHLPKDKQHPLWQSRTVARIVNSIISPIAAEKDLVKVYQDEGDNIREFNTALTTMSDNRKDMRKFVAIAGLSAIGTGLSIAASRAISNQDVIPGLLKIGAREVVGSLLVGAGVAGIATFGFSKARDCLKSMRACRWY